LRLQKAIDTLCGKLSAAVIFSLYFTCFWSL
jgi:hypothetical protein